MSDYKSLSDTRLECKYHVTFIPKLPAVVLGAAARSLAKFVSHHLWPSAGRARAGRYRRCYQNKPDPPPE